MTLGEGKQPKQQIHHQPRHAGKIEPGLSAEKEILSVGPPQGGGVRRTKPTGQVVKEMPVWSAIEESETTEGHDYSDRLGEGWKVPEGRRREKVAAMTHR